MSYGKDLIRFGLIGCGRVARYHAEAITHTEGAALQAVCDVIPERADQFEREFGGQACYDYRRLLDRKDVDVVCIATPSGSHPAIGIDAALAGKHVVSEKPIGLTLAEIDALVKACENSGVKLGVVHQNRFNPAIVQLRKAVEENRFGRISHASVAVRWNRGMDYYHEAPWRGTWAEDGGALMNQSIHAMDIFRWMMGDPESLSAMTATRLHAIEAEDVGVAAVRFRSGALGVIEASNNVYPANWEETISVFGDRGSATIGGVALNRIDRWEFADHDKACLEDEIRIASMPDPRSVYGKGHGRLLSEVARSIREDKPMPVTAGEGRAAVELVLAIYQSSELGCNVRFPVRNESRNIAAARSRLLSDVSGEG